MKLSPVLISKTILQLVLFSLFLGLFGIPSFNQYQRKETIIVKSELETTGIEAPAVTIQATQNNFGWKSTENGSLWQEFDLYEHCERINMTIEQCIQTDTITLKDFLTNVEIKGNFSAIFHLVQSIIFINILDRGYKCNDIWKTFYIQAPKIHHSESGLLHDLYFG